MYNHNNGISVKHGILTRHKLKKICLNISNFNFISNNSVSLIISLIYLNISKKYYFLNLNNLTYKYIPAIYGIFVSNYIINSYNIYYLNNKNNNIISSFLPLYYIQLYTIISNITNYKNKISYIRSSGTFGLLLRNNIDNNISTILLPSSKYIYINNSIGCYVGRNFNIFKNKEYLGSYSESFFNGIKSSVRGVAMNPVDHPNGGRTKAKSPELSLWG